MDLDALKAELKRDEGYRMFPYKCTAGKLTIGYGRNIEDRGLSMRESEVLLDNDIQDCINWLDKEYSWFKDLTDARQRALVNMVFNLGSYKFISFKKMIRAFALKQYDLAAIEAKRSRWYYQTGDRSIRIVEMIKDG